VILRLKGFYGLGSRILRLWNGVWAEWRRAPRGSRIPRRRNKQAKQNGTSGDLSLIGRLVEVASLRVTDHVTSPTLRMCLRLRSRLGGYESGMEYQTAAARTSLRLKLLREVR
jgi:hypothetical protein